MVSKVIIDAFNEQINKELYSEYLYLSMASYFSSQGLDGFENFFLIQVEEERFHAMKMYITPTENSKYYQPTYTRQLKNLKKKA